MKKLRVKECPFCHSKKIEIAGSDPEKMYWVCLRCDSEFNEIMYESMMEKYEASKKK